MLLESLREDYGMSNGIIIEDVTGMNEAYLDAEITWNRIVMEQLVVELNESADGTAINESAGTFLDKVIEWFKKMISKITNFIKDIFGKIVNNLRGLTIKLQKMQKIVSGNELKDPEKNSVTIPNDVVTGHIITIDGKIDRMNSSVERVLKAGTSKDIEVEEKKLKDDWDNVKDVLTKTKSVTYPSKKTSNKISSLLDRIGKVSGARAEFELSLKQAKEGNSLATQMKSKITGEKANYDNITTKRRVVSVSNEYGTKVFNLQVKCIKLEYSVCAKLTRLFKNVEA